MRVMALLNTRAMRHHSITRLSASAGHAPSIVGASRPSVPLRNRLNCLSCAMNPQRRRAQLRRYNSAIFCGDNLSSFGDDARPHGKADQSGKIEDVEALHQLSTMVFHRLGTDFQQQRDAFGGLAFSDKLQNLSLALC